MNNCIQRARHRPLSSGMTTRPINEINDITVTDTSPYTQAVFANVHMHAQALTYSSTPSHIRHPLHSVVLFKGIFKNDHFMKIHFQVKHNQQLQRRQCVCTPMRSGAHTHAHLVTSKQMNICNYSFASHTSCRMVSTTVNALAPL
jgi:hypothetical protein